MTRHPVRYHCELRQVSSLQKAEQPENKLPTTSGSHRKQGNSRKTSTSASLTTLKPLTVWITTTCGKFLEMGIPDHLTCLLRNLYAGQEATVKTRHGTMDCFQFGKGVHQDCILSPCLFNFMQNESYEMLGWMTHKLESRLLGEISITLDMQMTPLNGRNQREIKEPLMKLKEDSERAGLKLHIQKD